MAIRNPGIQRSLPVVEESAAAASYRYHPQRGAETELLEDGPRAKPKTGPVALISSDRRADGSAMGRIMSEVAVVTRNTLSENEQNLLEALIDPRAVVTITIPDSAPSEELFSNLEICCRASVSISRINLKINPIIGRILLVLQENPDKYRSKGYATFEDLLEKFIEVKMGYSRATAYQSMRLVKKFPTLPLDKWQSLGINKLSVLARYTQDSDPSFPKYLAAAVQAKHSVALIEWAVNRSLIAKGESHMRAVVIHMSGNLKYAWKTFKNDSRVQSVTGSELDGVIFESMMSECSSAWLHEDLNVEPTTPPVMGTVHGLCGVCKQMWQIDLPEMVSMNDLRGLMYDYHKQSSPNCDESVSNLIIHRPAAAVEER